MQDPPSPNELLHAAQEHLAEAVIPTLKDPGLRFRTLVAANVLAIVQRELAVGEEAARAEYERLIALLGETQMAFPAGSQLAVLIRAATRRLHRRVALGEFDVGPNRAALIKHLKRTVIRNLRVNNPGYLARVAAEDPSLSEEELESS